MKLGGFTVIPVFRYVYFSGNSLLSMDYNIPAISESPIMDVFPYFSGEEYELEQMEKFNALKASKPENTAEVEDTMEFDADIVADSY